MMKLLKLIFSLLSISLVGCQNYWAADPNFGSSVNQAVNDQIVNPNAASQAPSIVKGMDGVTAKTSIDNYQNSFIRRTPGNTGNSSNSGSNSGNQSSSSFGPSSSSTNMPAP